MVRPAPAASLGHLGEVENSDKVVLAERFTYSGVPRSSLQYEVAQYDNAVYGLEKLSIMTRTIAGKSQETPKIDPSGPFMMTVTTPKTWQLNTICGFTDSCRKVHLISSCSLVTLYCSSRVINPRVLHSAQLYRTVYYWFSFRGLVRCLNLLSSLQRTVAITPDLWS